MKKTEDMKWMDAILTVFNNERRPLHYTEIAALITEKGYRKSLGATPNDTVSANITTNIKNLKSDSLFIRIDRGVYALKSLMTSNSTVNEVVKDSDSDVKIITSFGIYWDREKIHWKTNPDLFGRQQTGATSVNFKDQIGIYLLHDTRETIYVGKATEQTIARRLQQHTTDRLNGRWNRFSWFGLYSIREEGSLDITQNSHKNVPFANIITLLEAVLIESIEPRQNRKQGDLLNGIEYLQIEDPEIKKKRNAEILDNVRKKLEQ